MKKDVFCGINFLRCRHMEKMRNLFFQSQCFNKIFSTKSKKEDKTYMSFLSRNLFCKNMWSSELFCILKWWLYLHCIFLFSFLTYEVSYSNNIKIFRRNVGFIFAIGFQTIFCGTYFCDWLIQNCIFRVRFLQFRAKITKISSAIIYDQKNFCP